MKEYWDLVIDSTLKVTRLMSGGDKEARNVIVVTDFWTLRILIPQ